MDKEKMEALNKNKDKLKERSNDEVNFGISNDILYVIGRKENEWVLESGACFYICNKIERLLTISIKKARWNLLMMEICMLKAYVQLS